MKPTAEAVRNELQRAGISMSECWKFRKDYFLSKGINIRAARNIASGRLECDHETWVIIRDLCLYLDNLDNADFNYELSRKCYKQC